MPPIRNSCVARGQLTTAASAAVYVVPAGNVLLLKSVLMLNQGAPQDVSLTAYNSDYSALAQILHQSAVATGANVVWSGWVALNADDRLQVDHGAASLNYWISGALLPSVSGF